MTAARVPAALVHGLEALRSLAYPRGLTIESGYRCLARNAQLPNAAKDSQHLYAAAADVQPAAMLGQVLALHAFSGVGWQEVGGLRLVRQ